MIISLSKEAKAQLLHTARRATVNPEVYVKGLLEQIFRPNSMYMIFNPIPLPDRLNALKVALEGILNMKEFFGFKFLTKEEATQETAIHSKFAWCENCRNVKEVSFEGFVNENTSKEYVGGDLVCQDCKSIVVTLYRPKTLLEIAAGDSDAVEIKNGETKPLKTFEAPVDHVKKILDFPKASEELLLYDYERIPTGQVPSRPGAWELDSRDGVETNMWRRLHICETDVDVRCDVCGRLK